MKKKWMIRRKSDGASFHILSTGETVFCQSVATCFPSSVDAQKMMGGLGLRDCIVVPTFLDDLVFKDC